MTKQDRFEYLLRLGDNALILGQRLSEWCGHGPALEQDIAMTNIALDLVGQARAWLNLAGAVEGKGRDEDQLAFLRDAWDYRNALLVEQPNRDFAYTIVRQFFFDNFHYYFLQALRQSRDEGVRAIAEKSLKEVSYHQRWSAEWMIRLGDGTDTSRRKMQTALDQLWPLTGELLQADALDQTAAAAGFGVDLDHIRPAVEGRIADVLRQATLTPPDDDWMQSGGKQGRHSEHLGYLLADMQWLQRAYPKSEW